MGLARTKGATGNGRSRAGGSFAAGQFKHLRLVELRDRLEVEAVRCKTMDCLQIMRGAPGGRELLTFTQSDRVLQTV